MAISWNKASKFGLLAVAVCAIGAGVTGCDMNQTSYTTENKIRIEQGTFYKEVQLAGVSNAMLDRIAYAYDHNGVGAVELTVTHLPSTPRSEAQKQANAIRDYLNKSGVASVRTTVLQVSDPRGALAIFSFSTYSAKPPEDCKQMPGMDGHGAKLDRDYEIGCENRTIIAKQVARPKDLAGRDVDMGDSDGQRLGVAVSGYRDGEPNKEIKGESASGN